MKYIILLVALLVVYSTTVTASTDAVVIAEEVTVDLLPELTSGYADEVTSDSSTTGPPPTGSEPPPTGSEPPPTGSGPPPTGSEPPPTTGTTEQPEAVPTTGQPESFTAGQIAGIVIGSVVGAVALTGGIIFAVHYFGALTKVTPVGDMEMANATSVEGEEQKGKTAKGSDADQSQLL